MPIVIILFYGAIVVMSVFISGYLSYQGFLTTAEEITLPLVVFLMSVVFLANLMISYFRSAGKRAWILALGIWALAATFSISSNFNFLYTNFMRDDVTRLSVARELQTFRDDLVATRETVEAMDATQDALASRVALDQELANLKRQVDDPLRPGCGAECRGHLAEVERILGTPVTNLAVPPVGAPATIVSEWYDRYSAAAETILETDLAGSSFAQGLALVRRIDVLLGDYQTAESVIREKGGLAALAQMAAQSDDVARQANAILPDGVEVAHARIDPTLGRLGEIVYSLQNGLGERPNPMATFVSFVMGSIVDVLPLMLAFALFGRGRLERAQPVAGPRGPGGRGRVMS